MKIQETRYNNQTIFNIQIPIIKQIGFWILGFGFCLYLVSWFLVISTPALALEQAGQDIAVLKAGVGARPLGMGGAFTAVSNNADAPYWNPAGLGFIDDNEITSMQTKLSTDADHYYVSYVRPALGGTLGISWIQVGMGNITETSSEVDSNNEVVNLSVFSYFSNAYMVSYGKKFGEYISFGLTAKYLTSDMFQISGGQASGYSVTPGLLLKLPRGWSLGVKIDELLNSHVWGTGTEERVPAVLRLGLAYAKSNPGLFAIDVSQTLKSGYASTAAVGYEWAKDGFSVRLGYADGLTAGAGFVSGNARVDYAYVTQADLSRDNVHRISLSGKW
ncbi:MAG: PorV/PorQ family protein [Candidatus Margulisbacteria bacterium]|nr:PorV/PorQ family protein [Candidatus Margulisiibacteriota bacterium]